MDSKDIEPPAGPEQDQIGILCLTLIGICILLVLRVRLNDYITVVIAIAQMICRIRSQLRRKKHQPQETAPPARVEADASCQPGEVARRSATGGCIEGNG
jgi:hypothetical protein